jgi:hypothetical protein
MIYALSLSFTAEKYEVRKSARQCKPINGKMGSPKQWYLKLFPDLSL